jgi:hypothetical protein
MMLLLQSWWVHPWLHRLVGMFSFGDWLELEIDRGYQNRWMPQMRFEKPVEYC